MEAKYSKIKQLSYINSAEIGEINGQMALQRNSYNIFAAIFYWVQQRVQLHATCSTKELTTTIKIWTLLWNKTQIPRFKKQTAFVSSLMHGTSPHHFREKSHHETQNPYWPKPANKGSSGVEKLADAYRQLYRKLDHDPTQHFANSRTQSATNLAHPSCLKLESSISTY